MKKYEAFLEENEIGSFFRLWDSILLLGVLHEALSVCCYSCTNIRYLKPYVTNTEGITMFASSSILTPFVTASSAKLAVGDIFIAAIPSKGVAYITSVDKSMLNFKRFASSISSNWPLFCISLLLAIDAGIIVWLLVGCLWWFCNVTSYISLLSLFVQNIKIYFYISLQWRVIVALSNSREFHHTFFDINNS